MFSSTEVGKYSATTGILVTNSTTVAVSLATPALVPPSGTSTEFVVTTAPAGTTNCVPGFRLDPGVSCSFGVQFAPLAAGVRSEKWTVNFADGVAAREVTLEGTAIAGAATGGTAPTGSSAANSPADGGGAALGWMHLFGLFALSAVGSLRRRINSCHVLFNPAPADPCRTGSPAVPPPARAGARRSDAWHVDARPANSSR